MTIFFFIPLENQKHPSFQNSIKPACKHPAGWGSWLQIHHWFLKADYADDGKKLHWHYEVDSVTFLTNDNTL